MGDSGGYVGHSGGVRGEYGLCKGENGLFRGVYEPLRSYIGHSESLWVTRGGHGSLRGV